MANEADNAVNFVRDVLAACERGPFAQVVYFVVLDKASKDNTLDLLRAFEQSEPRLKVVWAPDNRGVVDAYVAGYRAALASGADWILEIDAGYSHDPKEIAAFFPYLDGRFDCVFGSRFCPGGAITNSSWKRWMISRLGTVMANALLKTRLYDMTSGFQMFSRRALTAVMERGIRSRGPFFQTEMKAYCHGLRIVEVPIHYQAASHNVGRSALKDALRTLWMLRQMRQRGELFVS